MRLPYLPLILTLAILSCDLTKPNELDSISNTNQSTTTAELDTSTDTLTQTESEITTNTQTEQNTPSELILDESNVHACDYEQFIETKYSPNGTGALNSPNENGAAFTWKIHIESRQSLVVTIRFGNGSNLERPSYITLAGQSKNAVFAANNDWTVWQTETLNFEATSSGNYEITLQANNESGLPNIDEIKISSTGLMNVNLESLDCNTQTQTQTNSVTDGTTSTTTSTTIDTNTQTNTITATITGTDTETDISTACSIDPSMPKRAQICEATVSCIDGEYLRPIGTTGDQDRPFRAESEHFAVYWHDENSITQAHLDRGVNISTVTDAQVQLALENLEFIWSQYFSEPINMEPPFCHSAEKYKATVHFDDKKGLEASIWVRDGKTYAGMWIGSGASADKWGLAHEFVHGVQILSDGIKECGGVSCWAYESHANWAPHQIWPDEVHCSEMLANSTHLHYGNTRNRYCNWQFFEYIKDAYCPAAVNDIWQKSAPVGQRDIWQKLMYQQGWDIARFNDEFAQFAMQNVIWDYQSPDGINQGAIYRSNYGAIDDTQSNYSQRRLRLTQLESLDNNWQQNRRFQSPYHWAPQRLGYNVIELIPESGETDISIHFKGIEQQNANSGWRWAVVATNQNLDTARYSELQTSNEGQMQFCFTPGERLFLVVVATPTEYQKIQWNQPFDGTAYPSIYRYPYLVEFENAWPKGFSDGQLEQCPAGTQRHGNGNGCATPNTPATAYVGQYAKVLGGQIGANAIIKDHATIINGEIGDNATVGALSIVGVASNPHHGAANFNVLDNATLLTTMYPMGWFPGGGISGTAGFIGDIEYYSQNKNSGWYYGLVDDNSTGLNNVNDITIKPPYYW
ncbi:DUF6055 domain-containing protein [Marinicellulosiphila megalodicopiae]|uniref:DUF6055 domain-containing protein n=1 Tax=Marinicellulosiphila megalodicopiae TaxID=2724896 RepID=UPI003BB007E2